MSCQAEISGGQRDPSPGFVCFSDIIDLGHAEHFSFSSFAVACVTTKDMGRGTVVQLSLSHHDFSQEFLMMISGLADALSREF